MALMYIPPPGQTRRSFLKRGVFGGLLLAVGGAGFLASRSTRLQPLPSEGLLALSAREYAVLHAIAERLVPTRAGAPTVEQVRVAFNADRTVAKLTDDARTELKQLIGLFENGLTNFLFGARTRPFTGMDPLEQDRVLNEWQHSSLTLRRTGFQALRTLLLACYYGSPQTWAAVGYPGPPQGLHDAQAPAWKGGGVPRPPGNGVMPAAHPEPAPEGQPLENAQPKEASQ